MNYREVEIYAPKDIGMAGTEVIDINVSDVLSSIELIWQTTVATAALMTAPHVDCLTKVEVVDGSDALFSMSGKDAQALAFYANGRMPFNCISVKATEYMRSIIPIYFGRYPFDKQLALDPKKFKNLQLKVTWDRDAANAGVTVNELTVRGWVFDQKAITPRGFLMSKDIRNYPPVANTYAYTDLPVDYPYRLLMIESYSTDKEPGEVLAVVKLSEDNDKRVPFDMTGPEIVDKLSVPAGEIEENFEGADDVTATDLYVTPTVATRPQAEVGTVAITAAGLWSQGTVTGNKVAWGEAVVAKYYGFVVRGFCPHHCLLIPLGDLKDLDDIQDVKGIGSLRLITQGAAAVGTSPNLKVIIQQLRAS